MKLPRILVLFAPGAASALDVASAADGVCELIFVVSRAWSGVDEMLIEVLHALAITLEVDPQTDAGSTQIQEYGPDGIVTFCETLLRTTANVAARLGLAYHTERTAALLTNKYEQRKALQAASIPTPVHFLLSNPTSVDAALAEVGTPAIVKPVTGSGSRDTFPVDDVLTGRLLLKNLLTENNEDFVLERRLIGDPSVAGVEAGDYVSVESVFDQGVLRHFALTGRLPLEPPLREGGGFSPATVSEPETCRAYSVATEVCQALGIETGVVHTELKLTAAGPQVIEVNGRLGGFIGTLTRMSTGINPVRLALQSAAGEPCDLTPSRGINAIAFSRVLLAPPQARKFVAVSGLNEARQLPGIHGITIERSPGDELNASRGFHDRIGYAVGAVQTHSDLFILLSTLSSTLKIEFV